MPGTVFGLSTLAVAFVILSIFTHTVLWFCNVVIILYSWFRSIYTGGGRVPKTWRPENIADLDRVQWCDQCEAYKAPRSHHCRQCGYCVKKMDHHCPWINNCVGNDNHVFFIMFLVSVPIGTGQSVYIIAKSLYFIMSYQMLFTMVHFYILIGGGLALGVALAVTMLLVFQLIGICKNKTDIEEWIVQKAHVQRPEFRFPYNLGVKENIGEFLRSSLARDGIKWKTIEGCDQYTFTAEQLQQKREKAALKQAYKVKQSSKCMGCNYGVCTMCRGFPILERRINVKEGEFVCVWNYDHNWVYGEKLAIVDKAFKPVKPRVRGWFPIQCLGDPIPTFVKKVVKIE